MLNRIFIALIAIVTIFGCSIDNNTSPHSIFKEKPRVENTFAFTSEDCGNVDSIALVVSYAISEFYEELMRDGDSLYNVRNALFQANLNYRTHSTSTIPLDTLIHLMAYYHGADISIINNYFNTIRNNYEFLSDTSNRNAVINGIFCYGYNSEGGSPRKCIICFTTIANIIQGGDLPCTPLGIFGRMFDAASETVSGLLGSGAPFLVELLEGTGALHSIYDYYAYVLAC